MHLLLDAAIRRPTVDEIPYPQNAKYERMSGYWMIADGTAMMMSNDPKRPKPSSKKFDVETGEDQKGE